jgi:hypothetical protein
MPPCPTTRPRRCMANGQTGTIRKYLEKESKRIVPAMVARRGGQGGEIPARRLLHVGGQGHERVLYLAHCA